MSSGVTVALMARFGTGFLSYTDSGDKAETAGKAG